MSSPQEQFTALARQSQEAVVSAVDSWTRTVQQAVSQMSAPTAQADPNQVIDQVFDFAKKMLEMQRDFAKNLVQSSTSAVESAARQAQGAAQQAQGGAQSGSDNA